MASASAGGPPGLQQRDRHAPIVQQQREVIELSDSDAEGSTTKAPAARSVSSHLQPPFDPIGRATPPINSGKSNHRASASPSIASLINPENAQQPIQPKSSHPSSPSAGLAPERPNPPSVSEKSKQQEPHDRSPKSKAISAPQASAPSPKPSKPAIPVRTGNGLLSNVFAGSNGNNEPELKPPNIYLHVPLNGEQNKYINFAKLAEERYGWAALNPRLARAKLALQLDSGDEMIMDGSESESNADTGGTVENMLPKKRQKRSYQDVYDKNDPFIDDSEMLWEEQAAASKDGFFVYSGPLVPEGQKPQIERADGTIKRGRGRGRGSRGSTSTRGTGTTGRKPRITKKEKEKLEKEKEERERFSALVAAQASKGLLPR